MRLPEADDIARRVKAATEQWALNTPRTQQAMIRKQLGVSDVGHCREYARRLTVEEAFTDTVDHWQAFVGTAIGDFAEKAMAEAFPNLTLQPEITVTLPSGIELPGHPDVVAPTGVIDIKTVDGLTAVRRNGPDTHQQFQRHLYALGCIQAGLLPPECWVANVWLDRSGREPEPHVQVEPYDDMWVIQADQWLEDVLYAVKVGEEAMKDRPIEFCRKCCEYFSACRGEDATKDREGGGLITDPAQLDAIAAYIQGRDMVKAGERMKEDSHRALAGISGSDGTNMVRWTRINEVSVPGFSRAGYDRLDIKPLPQAVREKE